MTTIPQQLLNEKRLRKLKLRNIQWVTVPPPSHKYQSTGTSRRIGKNRSSFVVSQNNQETKQPYFMNSEISFSNKEMQILKECDSTTQPKNSFSRSYQSQLEQLQSKNKENERKDCLLLSANRSMTSSKIRLIPSSNQIDSIERSDSIISFKEIEFDEDESNDRQSKELIRHDPSAVFNTASVTIGDIKEHVWMWCHNDDEKNDEKNRTVKFFNANFVDDNLHKGNCENGQLQQPRYKSQQNRQKQKIRLHPEQIGDSDDENEQLYKPEKRNLVVHFNSNAGERKVKNIIKSYSKIEQERQAIQSDNKHENNKFTDQMKRSYCAYQYQKYLYDNDGTIPYFLDDVDFSEVKKAKSNLRKSRGKKSLTSRTGK